MSSVNSIGSLGEKRWLAPVLLTLVVLAGIAPFADRAIYIDEHIFLRLADSALENPLFPADTPAIFFGSLREDFASHTHPPVGEYFLAIIRLLVPIFDEVAYRFLFAVFPVLAVISFHELARRFSETPLSVSMLFAFCPAFFVLSPTLMMDVPMLAFLLAGVALFFNHLDGRGGRLVPASACFVLAAGTGYTALVPLACLFLWVLFMRPGVRELAAITAAPVALGLWLGAMTLHFGRFPLTDTLGYYTAQPTFFLRNVGATFSFLGGVGLFPWAVPAISGLSRRQRILFALVSVVAAVMLAAGLGLGSTPYALWFVVLASWGIFLLAAVIWNARRRWTEEPAVLFMLAWILATLAFFALVADMINARYILLVLPPAYLVLFPRLKLRHAVVVAGLGLTLSVTVAYADYSFVNAYPDWVRSNIAPLEERGYRVWNAAESGLRFYLEERGIETLTTTDTRPTGGDMVVRQNTFRYSLSEELAPLLVLVRSYDLDDPFPVRSFNSEAGAGLHDSRSGLVPYVLSDARHDRVELWQLSPLVEGLPQTDVSSSKATWSEQGVILVQTEDRLRVPFQFPEGTELRYELEGEGRVEKGDGFIDLIRSGEGQVVWRNVRVVPGSFPR